MITAQTGLHSILTITSIDHKLIIINKNALTEAFSLACLKIRLRNEEAINSTRNRIYSLKVFHSLLYSTGYTGYDLTTDNLS